ncbi:MAG TPA: TIGR02302 family protein, partial [Roseiarcus sp.]|nr:TIGR02302 family protein [Roseiarcus sp.]
NDDGFRLDAWIDPPVYTGKPPIMLDALCKTAPPGGAPVKVEAPVGSTLVLRADSAVTAVVEGALTPAQSAKGEAAAIDTSAAPGERADAGDRQERRWTVKGAAKLAIARNGSPLSAFEIAATPAGRPKIALTAPAKRNARGSLTLRYRTSDEYGIAAAEADFAKPVDEAKGPPARSLVEPPRMALELPPTATGVGEAQTTSDLSEHPWAGAKVRMTLRAEDVAGEEGTSEPVEITLPQRQFANPLAKALVEERRDLVLDPDHNRPRVANALDALLIAPELFGETSSVFLGLNVAEIQLKSARTDADLVGVADFLWSMALQIEDGDASQAERDLRAAEQRLREALDRGASDEEIRELMKELRAAAENFARELAENAQRQQQGEEQDSDAETLDRQDLQSLLDRMEDSARSGDRGQAQAMLDQLQNLFENLRGAKRGRASQAQREMRRQLGELDRLMRDQQKLRDDTFREDQRARRRGEQGDDSADAGQPTDDQTPLEERQKALRDRLDELQRRMKGLGLKSEKGFDEAEGAMGEAEGDLKEGESGRGKAIGPQGRALQALREGAEGLERQMKGQGDGEGEGETAVEPGEGRHGRDPLDRDYGDVGRGMSTGRLGDAIGAAERARRVMEELRRRLSDPNRPEEERDYLERLLNRNPAD